GLGAEIVVMHADTEIVGGIPAGADAGIPAVAAVTPATFQAEVLARAVVVVGVVVAGAEETAARADIPGRGDVQARVAAGNPAAQGVFVLALVDVVIVERVLDHQVAQIGIAALDADAEVARHL